MSTKKSQVDKKHYRKTSDDGKRSYLYRKSDNPLGLDACVEVADHHEDGTTTAYERGNLFDFFFNGDRGKKK